MNEYRKIVDDHLRKLRELRSEQDRIQRETKSVADLVRAALRMLPDGERSSLEDDLDDILAQRHGLTKMVRSIITVHYPDYLTPVQIRNEMESNGFDFSFYSSNPLSSIHSVLKRTDSSHIETKNLPDGTIAYRWKLKKR
jgi:hypothetical protein